MAPLAGSSWGMLPAGVVATHPHFVDGAPWAEPAEPLRELIDPWREEPFAAIPIGGEATVARAVASARAALPRLAALGTDGRIARVDALVQLVRARAEQLAATLVAELGKPIRAARREIDSVLTAATWFRDHAARELGPLDSGEPGLAIVREPVGVVAAITPFNFPLQLLSWKLFPAFLCGCPVVCKPDPRTAISTAMLASFAVEAGWPPGAFSVVHGGAETGAHLVAHDDVAKVAFTGSVAAGRAVYSLAAAGLKRVTLELGGCSPLVVCEDARVDARMPALCARAFGNSGQFCYRISRVYVHRSRQRELVERWRTAAAALVVGDPRDERTELGPLVDRASTAAVHARIADTVQTGAHLVLDGRTHARTHPGLVGPTIFDDVPDDAAIMTHETFGPTLAIAAFDELDDAIARANAGPYGLGAFALTEDPATADRLSRALDSGTVWCGAIERVSMNAPFGGRKQSGIGIEKSRWAFDAYLLPKAIYSVTP